MAHRAFETMQSTIARQKLAAYPPDHTIEIPRNTCTFLEFDRAAELIELGYKKAEEHLAKSMKVSREIGADTYLGQALRDLGILYSSKGESDKARECFI